MIKKKHLTISFEEFYRKIDENQNETGELQKG